MITALDISRMYYLVLQMRIFRRVRVTRILKPKDATLHFCFGWSFAETI